MFVKKSSWREPVLYSVVMAVWAIFAIAIIQSETIEAFLFSHSEVQLANCCVPSDQPQ